ncbi:hypothetical protein JG687_00011947 [Phytophthora cactorum]|uniref:Ankyrin repeat-containing domain n=1 Tax=Phytophthora cactorum TaxID=29920 RepID=A0A8T1U552_9STRA|nr:hypothetical protein JG687_00011947 [Phytophthora cactorum]
MAIRQDRYNTVKWMVEHIPFRRLGYDILKLFHELGTSGTVNNLIRSEESRAHQVAACANRSEGCSAKVIKNAVDKGHVTVLNWLHHQYPEHAPMVIDRWAGMEHKFEVVLFLHVHFPQVITPEFLANVRQYDVNRVISAWLADNCPSP